LPFEQVDDTAASDKGEGLRTASEGHQAFEVISQNPQAPDLGGLVGGDFVGGEYGNVLGAVAYGGNLEMLRYLLDQGMDVNLQGGQHGDALGAAAASGPWNASGRLEMMQFLLDRGADLKTYGPRALAIALEHRNRDAVQWLRDRGVGVDA
jgi:hypothetical protein